MRTVLITGAKGFIGRNLAMYLRPRPDVLLRQYDLGDSGADLRTWASQADVVFHLAGVNRPENVDEFESGNAGFTETLCRILVECGRRPHVIVSSSIQAELDNPYGRSKRHAEETLREFRARSGARVSIFRLKNVFGKWSRPNYNSVVATFCYNVAHDLPIQVHEPDRAMELVHVDDVVRAFLEEMDNPRQREGVLVTPDPIPSYTLTLDDLAGRIRALGRMQESLEVPDFSLPLNRKLYATYLAYVDPARWEYGLDTKRDGRGSLAEFIKSPWFGQVFLSRTLPGITRGNHYHHVKTEKFLTIAGEGLIRFRHVEGTEVLQYHVRGEDYRVVEIPPGYTHSITNVGKTEMITLFWASEPFDPDRPDTWSMPVDPPAKDANP
jgi:UDP-2-acetamido-2,6-beta-L-arabino-hexul-4-ose reductase